MHTASSPRVTRWGRGVLIAALVAGFLAMHGFLAVVSPASGAPWSAVDAHGAVAAHAAPPERAPPEADGGVGLLPFSGGGHVSASLPGPAGGGHAPMDHHDTLMGCVAALVGVTALGLSALLLLGRDRSAVAGRVRQVPTCRASLLVEALPHLPGRPRVTLCVIRV